MTYQLTDLDRKIIYHTQNGLPLTETPFVTLAQQIGILYPTLLERIETLKAKKVVRRIAAIPNHYRIGYTANGMTVWDIPDEIAEELGQKVGDLPFVSHCYLRPRHPPHWNYNLFAMIHARSKKEVTDQAEVIKMILEPHLRSFEILFSKRILKKTGFRITPEESHV